ncbi:SOS response-associated peptidase [Salsuginibacillus kocurii]|uniref:SOS response-associated peptidase n=1 Tax=Salsuginibacillus kocurii TaxID=427078 RepID=UPI000370FB69|nr:SOS response-associated peptidase [Salsuginibacillus kocurii]
MCGRFTLTVDLEHLIEQFTIDEVTIEEFEVSYNIAPSQQVVAIINNGENNRLGKLRWGLIPFWAKDKKVGYKMINARAETVAEKTSFKRALKKQRCIIPADAFYEWKQVDGQKQPYRIHQLDNTIFGFAGLWEKWTDEDGTDIFSCTIITTKANEFMAEIHGRMPVILPKKHYKEWLHPATQDTHDLQELLQPIESSNLTAHEVSSEVNNPRNNYQELINPL